MPLVVCRADVRILVRVRVVHFAGWFPLFDNADFTRDQAFRRKSKRLERQRKARTQPHQPSDLASGGYAEVNPIEIQMQLCEELENKPFQGAALEGKSFTRKIGDGGNYDLTSS